jgi:hypothetical protein
LFFPYDFKKETQEGGYAKSWVWWTGRVFTHIERGQTPIPLELADGQEFHIDLVPSPDYPKERIDTFTVRLHHVSCPNLSKGVGYGNLESFVWQRDAKGDLTVKERIVPTTDRIGDELPPYWVALPSEKSPDSWGTFVILVIDHERITRLLLQPPGRLTFKWNGNRIGSLSREKAKLKAKSLELHVVFK